MGPVADDPAPSVVARTKLAIPVPRPRARLVARPRLLIRLDSGGSGKLTLVCAPTGSGKTSVLAEWARASDALFVWVALDRRDDEPVRFWRCVVSGLALASPAAAATSLRRLSPPVVAIDEEILPVLVNDVAEVDRPLVVVLDDFQLIADPEIHEQLDYLNSLYSPSGRRKRARRGIVGAATGHGAGRWLAALCGCVLPRRGVVLSRSTTRAALPAGGHRRLRGRTRAAPPLRDGAARGHLWRSRRERRGGAARRPGA